MRNKVPFTHTFREQSDNISLLADYRTGFELPLPCKHKLCPISSETLAFYEEIGVPMRFCRRAYNPVSRFFSPDMGSEDTILNRRAY